VCSGVGGTCGCPNGSYFCAASGTCIPNGTCCTNSNCTVTGQICPSPGSTCQCTAGNRVCTATNSCIPNSNCCVPSDCPLTSQSSGTTCNNGSCQITGCNGGFFDVDGSYTNGCECADNGAGNACGSASALGTLAPGAQTSVNGTLPPQGQEDWYLVTFTVNSNGHPHIFFNSNPGNLFRLEIVNGSCGGGDSGCGNEGGVAGSVTDWEMANTQCAVPPCTIPVVPGSGGTVIVKVTRTTAGLSCVGYGITFAN
jgi:hypothetical protein